MPGLVGLIGNLPRQEALLRLGQMLDALNHESFYSRKIYEDESLGLYVGWLSHPGSFSDGMPLQSPDGDITFVFAGEVFTANGSPVANGNPMQLPFLYQEMGEGFFAGLNGTYSGILADRRHRRLCLFNDRLGYERIYYADVGGSDVFCFSSEAKAILRLTPETRSFNPEGLAQFLRYGCTFEQTTLYRGIRTLPPASLWVFSQNNPIPLKTKYFLPEEWGIDQSLDSRLLQERFNDTFPKTLAQYFSGNLSPALSLTGGWDTRMILAGYSPQPKQLPCYTFAGPVEDTMDVRQARKVAGAARQDHLVLRLQSDFLEGFASQAEKTAYVSDGYGSILWSHEIYLNRLAREVSAVRLTGNFGSEVLRAVSTFKEMPLHGDWYQGELRSELLATKEQLKASYRHENPGQFAAFKEVPWKLATIARLAGSQLQIRTPYLDNEILRMACSSPIGVSGTTLPISFVRQMFPELARIPTDQGESSGVTQGFRRLWFKGTFKLDYRAKEGSQYFISQSLDLLSHYRLMPAPHRYLEYRRWLRGPLGHYVNDLLRGGNSFVRGFFGVHALNRTLDDFLSGRRNNTFDVAALMTLELINKCLLRSHSTCGAQSLEADVAS